MDYECDTSEQLQCAPSQAALDGALALLSDRRCSISSRIDLFRRSISRAHDAFASGLSEVSWSGDPYDCVFFHVGRSMYQSTPDRYFHLLRLISYIEAHSKDTSLLHENIVCLFVF